jgi:purine-binding chemotaxis protein CheW
VNDRLVEMFGADLSETALEILRRRSASLSQAEEITSAEDTVGLLLFRLGEEWYAARIGHVREIYNEYLVTRIPRVPDHILGVINVRGEIVSVTDIATLMRVPSRQAVDLTAEMPSAIIVDVNDTVSAVVVDEIGDIVDVPITSLEPPLAALDKSQAEYVNGSVHIDTRLIGIVHFEKALEPIGESA